MAIDFQPMYLSGNDDTSRAVTWLGGSVLTELQKLDARLSAATNAAATKLPRCYSDLYNDVLDTTVSASPTLTTIASITPESSALNRTFLVMAHISLFADLAGISPVHYGFTASVFANTDDDDTGEIATQYIDTTYDDYTDPGLTFDLKIVYTHTAYNTLFFKLLPDADSRREVYSVNRGLVMLEIEDRS